MRAQHLDLSFSYRNRAKTGQTINFLLTTQRDATVAKRFFRKAFQAPNNPSPWVINVDQKEHQ